MHLYKMNTPLLLYLHTLLALALLLHNNNNNYGAGATSTTATQQQQTTTFNSGTANLMQVNFEQTLSAKLAEEEAEAKKENFPLPSLTSSATSAATATATSSTTLLLSRKRRYLLFPEGSSFQLVWDGIIGVVDYVNYLILGITVALAWELPSKAPSEMIEDIRIQLQEGTLGQPMAAAPSGRRNDTINNITYVDTTKLKAAGKPLTYINLSQTQTKQQNIASNYHHRNKNLIPAFHAPMHYNYYRPPTTLYPYSKQSGLSAENKKYRGNVGGGGGGGVDVKGGNQYYYPIGKNNWRRKDAYYYSKNVNPFGKWTKVKTNDYGYTPAGSKYPWWNLTTRLSNSLRGKPRPVATANRRVDSNHKATSNHKETVGKNPKQQQQQQKTTGYYQSNATVRKHRIYPVFGKRSITKRQLKNANTTTTVPSIDGTNSAERASELSSDILPHHRQRRSGITGHELSKWDRMHIRHHRRTRQTLYEKIEKYLDKRGSHGQHCVLRTLCETAQKSHDHMPGSFVGELMRTVFTLPEAIEEYERNLYESHGFEQHEVLHHRQRRYDEANAFTGDCAARYQHCKDSLWASEFVM